MSQVGVKRPDRGPFQLVRLPGEGPHHHELSRRGHAAHDVQILFPALHPSQSPERG